MTAHGLPNIPIKPIAEEFRADEVAGRAKMWALALPIGLCLLVVNIYVATGANDDSAAAGENHEIFEAVFEEIEI